MFARVNTAQGPPEGLDRLISAVREQLSAATRQAGFRGFYLLVDRPSGKLITVSLWETRAAAQAVEARAAAQRRDVAQSFGLAAPPAVEIYEVALQA